MRSSETFPDNMAHSLLPLASCGSPACGPGMTTPLGGGARGLEEGGVTGGTPAPEDRSTTRHLRMTTSEWRPPHQTGHTTVKYSCMLENEAEQQPDGAAGGAHCKE